MILAANDMADLEIDVVGARGQMIGRHAVAAQEREVFDVVGRFDLLAINGVVEADSARQCRGGRGSAGRKARRQRRGGRFRRGKVRACRG